VLEKAITGSVKLCVVAPTVNVHVADKSLKFRSGISETALKQFLNNEILMKYSFLYKQKTVREGSTLFFLLTPKYEPNFHLLFQ
jgi:hypothetical protein